MRISNLRYLQFVGRVSTLVALALCLNLSASAQYASKESKSPRKNLVSQGRAMSATLTASLVDPGTTAKEKTATVQVRVAGVKLIDPAMTNKRPTKGQGHLHYRVDSGPVIATTTTKLSFHELTPGKHQIVVMLANNDHSPAGPEQTLEITVP
jgi:hypothetical protein